MKYGANYVETSVHAPSDAHDGLRQLDAMEWYQSLNHEDSNVDEVPSLMEYPYSD